MAKNLKPCNFIVRTGGEALSSVEATAKALEGVSMISPKKIIETSKSIDKIKYVNENDARDIIESYTHYKSGNNKSPATRWAGWFQSVNAANKKFIIDDIQNDPKLRNAMLSLFYDVYKTEFNFNISFNDFLNTEITLYRGVTLADKKGVGQEGFSAFSTTKNRVIPYADEQALGRGQVKEIKIKPKDTYGAVNYIGGGEIEVLVPTDFKKETLKDDFDRLVELNIGVFNEEQLKYIEKLYDKEDYISGVAFAKSIISSKPKSISSAYHAAKKDGSNPELVKAVEDLLGTGKEKSLSYPEMVEYLASHPELMEEGKAERRKIGGGAKKAKGKEADPILEALEKGKIKGVAGMNTVVWNAAIDTIKAAYIAGKSLAEAINEGIAYLKKKGEDVSKYQDALDDIRKAEKPRVATFFSGAGTMEAALPDSESVMAVEYSPTYMKAYNDAFGTKYEARDVTQIDPEEVKAANPDIFHASPVCKNFSKAKSFNTVRKQDMDSAESVARVIREAQPPIVTIENVPDYQKYAPFSVIIQALKDAGYTYDVGVYNAADYGGVQNRTRLLVRAVKDGKLPALPEKQKPGDWYKAVEDLIDDAPNTKFIPKTKEEHWEVERINKMIEDGRLDASKPIITMGASAYKGEAAAANAGNPSPTLLSSSNQVPRIIMPDGRVKRVTPEMMKRLMDLPLSYPVPADAKVAKEVLGNGMDGAFTKALVEPLIKQFSPEQKLKQAFKEWRNEQGKMGIAPNWERLAEADIKLLKALGEYIATKLKKGAYDFSKFLKDIAASDVENIDADKERWRKFYDDAVKQAGKAIKSAVEKTAGIKRSTKSEVQRIIDRAFAIGMGMGAKEGFVKGATAGMKAGAIEGRTQAVDMFRNALANLSGELTAKQISAIVERMGRLKTFSEAAKQNFIDYADKVIEDANYIAKEKKATEIRKAVKQIGNRTNVTANDQSLYKSFASLSISHLTPSDLDRYMEWGMKIKNRALKPGDRAQLASFIEQAQQRQNAIVQERGEKMREGRMRNLRAEFDEMESAGTLPDGISTFEEYVAYKKPKPRGETLEDKIALVNKRLREIPEGENKMIDKLRNVDLSVLNKEDLTLIDNSLYNYIDTGKLYGIGDPLTKAEYLGKVKAAVNAGLKTRRQVDRKDVERLGMSNLFTTLGETKDVAAKLRGLLIQPWLSAATKANSKYIEIETALMAKADKLKIKQPNWNRIDLFGFLNEGEGNPELFEKLKEQKLLDLETLRERVEQNEGDKDISSTAQAQEYAYNAIKESAESLGLNENSTLESIREKLSENELAFYDETRKYLDEYSPKAIENMELYGNKEVGITKNYWPRTTNKINERPTGVDAFDLYGSEYVGKNMFGREKGRSRLLGKAGYYTPVGQENYFNGLKETMLIAEAAHEYHGMQALYNTPEKGFGQLIKGQGAADLKQLMIDWIMDTKNVGRYQGGVANIAADILNAIQKGFTRALINNPTQVIKQPTALAYTFAEAPESTIKAMGLVSQAMIDGKDSPLAKAINGLFETTTLGQRLYHPEMIEVKEKYTIDKPQALKNIQELLKGFNASIGGNLLVPVDAIVSQVATLAGYIQQAERSGKKFNIFDEQAKGYDMVAAAAADQMQAKTNNENAAIYFSKKQLNNRALYYLGNFQANAVRNLYISIRKIVSGRTKQEVKEGFQGVAGYVLSASLFVGAGMLSTYLTTATAFFLYQGIMNALGDTEDDEEEKKRILAYLNSKLTLNAKRRVSSEAVSVATGVYGIMARAALEATLAGLEQAYYKTTEEEEETKDRIFFTPEASGYAGVVADNIISPLELTAKATDPQVEAMAQTGLLAAKVLGQSAIGFYTQNLLNAKKLKEKEAKARKEEQTKTLEQKAFPKKKKLAEAKKEWTKSIEEGNASKAKAAFENVVRLSDDTPYITAIDLRESFYKDKVRPSVISEGDEFVWLDYVFTGNNGDYKIGDAKLKDLIPPSERQKYIDEYKKELDKLNKMTSVMNKTIKVKNSKDVFVNWAAPFDWVKQVQDKIGKK